MSNYHFKVDGRDLIFNWRDGSAVERCHALRHIGSYTVGQHCHDMLSLLYALWPDPPPNLVKAVHFHDTHETVTGDLPANMKWGSSRLGAAYAEEEICARVMLGLPDFGLLTEEELNWLWALDVLEFWLWTRDQLKLGNQNLKDFESFFESWFGSHLRTIPKPIDQFVQTLRSDNATESK